MNKLFFAVTLCCLFHQTFAQEKANATFFQFGLTANFLQQVDQEYSGGNGGSTGYEFSKLYPLPGFMFGFDREMRLGDLLFFRTGGMLSYHVTSAEINAHSATGGELVAEYNNVKARFRNTYVQVPLDLGISFGAENQFSIYTGLKGSFLLINGSKWKYTETNYHYDFTVSPPVYLSTTNPHEEETKLDIHKTDIAIELGFTQDLSDNFKLEEKLYKGLTHIGNFLESAAGNNLEQLTFEVSLAVKISRKIKV